MKWYTYHQLYIIYTQLYSYINRSKKNADQKIKLKKLPIHQHFEQILKCRLHFFYLYDIHCFRTKHNSKTTVKRAVWRSDEY